MMEYCNGGELFSYLQDITEKKKLSENFLHINESFWNIIEDCLNGLVKMEKKRVQHRDIKPENILLHYDSTGKMRAKICDFGLARNVDYEKNNANIAGTPIFFPPEAVIGYRKQDADMVANTKGDVWAFGCILLRMRLDVDMHRAICNEKKLYKKLLKITPEDIATYFEGDEDLDGLKALNIAMLSPDPKLRPSAEECLEMFKKVRSKQM